MKSVDVTQLPVKRPDFDEASIRADLVELYAELAKTDRYVERLDVLCIMSRLEGIFRS